MHTHHTYNRFQTLRAGLVLLAGMFTTGLQAQTEAPVVPQASINKNYIISYTARDTNITNPILSTLTNYDMLRTVQYFDGLGRPLQTVQIKGSANGDKDVIAPMQYDQYGRQSKNFLPYVAPTGAPGSYRANALNTGGNYATSEQKTFYNQTGQNYVNIPTPYAATVFEASPRSRVQEQGAPGDAWQPQTARSQTSGRTVVVEYATNNILALTDTANTKFVALYKATTAATQVITISRAAGTLGRYDANQLSVTISKDENWMNGRGGTVEEYKDKEGHVVLKRTFNWKPGTPNKLEILSTYYVYDDSGNLAFVLPPKADPDNATSMSQVVLDELCYQYRYDARGRLTQKKLPGKDWEFFLYNKLDLVVGTQDGVQRGKTPQEWTVTRYDDMGRVVLTGIYIHPSSVAGTSYRAALQTNMVDTQTTLWETPTGAMANYGYTTATFPAAITTTLAVNYYDDYSFAGSNPYPFVAGSTLTKGKPTGSLVNVLGTTNMLMSVMYYDDQGRPIKTFSQHYLNGAVNANNYDEIRTAYNFAGEATTTIRKHFTLASGATPALVVTNRYTYDHLGRKIDSYQRTGTAASPEVLIARNEYNEVGQLYQKKLHSENTGTSFLQNITYNYNERGWLKMINDPAAAPPADNSKLFSMELKYTDGTYKQFNGNITNQLFVNTGSTTDPIQTFTYQYDQLNRLTSGISTGATLPANNMAETAISYDALGNIKTLTRDAATPYVYTYLLNGTTETSRLKSVSGITTGDYAYDLNGNMKTDARNGTALTYNLLNLPASVTKTGINLSYIYNAGGQKLRKISNVTGTTDYINGIVYNTISSVYRIDFTQTEEGRAMNNNDGTYRYQYDLKDQLGNVRLTFQKNATTGKADRVQSDNYYAFGMRKSINPTVLQNKYLYNGKEIQDETGDYDYGARHYDPVIARWTAIDKFAEKYTFYSPYSFVEGNPITNVDINGDWTVSRHYMMTMEALQYSGANWQEKSVLSHYASVYADNPQGHLIWNNVAHPTYTMSYRDYDYSGTANSQKTDWSGTGYNYNIWHSMRSPWEKKMFNAGLKGGISEESAMLRGLGFGWSQIFKSARKGKLYDLEANSEGIQEFGQGMHALQDAYAHEGNGDEVGFDHLIKDRYGDLSQAQGISISAVMVYSIMSGDKASFNNIMNHGFKSMDLKGISGNDLKSLNEKVEENGNHLRYNWSTKKYDVR